MENMEKHSLSKKEDFYFTVAETIDFLEGQIEKLRKLSVIPTQQEVDSSECDYMCKLLKTKVYDLNISVRSLNCLKAAEINTIGDLVQFNKSDLLKFRNFGKASANELEDLLESLGLSFSMDVSKYLL